MCSKILEKSPLIVLFIIWIYWLYLLGGQFNWNLIKMYAANDSLYWHSFVIVSCSFTLFIASMLFGFNLDYKQDDSSDVVHMYDFDREGDKD